MQSKIRVLDEHTINKIAAGEVIENPASVVKELVENSLDAGATEICVEIRGGGRQLIRITDNGCGMIPDDAVLCLERHATSKIRGTDDLHELDTMGFRGEAIPSIASISKFTLLTCPQDAKEGTMVIVDGGRIVQSCPAACAPGTTIEVKSLFFNVPVRKKFQKSPAHDANEILKMLTFLALGNPQKKFQLISNQETLLTAPIPQGISLQEQLRERISAALGRDFVQEICYLEGNNESFHIYGFIGLPSCTRHNRTGQFLFINRRNVVSPLVTYAVREGYGPTLGTNRHPVYVLHVSMPGDLVDVNVHPQKKEVRLRQDLLLKALIIKTVESALQKEGISTPKETLEPPFQVNPFFFASKGESKEQSTGIKALAKIPFQEIQKRQVPPPSLLQPSSDNENVALVKHDLFPGPSKPFIPIPKIIGCTPGYILIDPATLSRFPSDGLCLMDQRAAHSRIIFEKLQQSSGSIPVQPLLIPYHLEATPAESGVLRELMETLNNLGIGIKEFGPDTFVIDAIPQVFGKVEVGNLIPEVVHKIKEGCNSEAFKQEKKKMIALAASRSAVNRSKRLTLEEAQELVNSLMHCDIPYRCPMGKPTILHISSEDLAKQFLKC